MAISYTCIIHFVTVLEFTFIPIFNNHFRYTFCYSCRVHAHANIYYFPRTFCVLFRSSRPCRRTITTWWSTVTFTRPPRWRDRASGRLAPDSTTKTPTLTTAAVVWCYSECLQCRSFIMYGVKFSSCAFG